MLNRAPPLVNLDISIIRTNTNRQIGLNNQNCLLTFKNTMMYLQERLNNNQLSLLYPLE